MKIICKKGFRDTQGAEDASEEDAPPLVIILGKCKDAYQPYDRLKRRHTHVEGGVCFDRVQLGCPVGVAEPEEYADVKKEVKQGDEGGDNHDASSRLGLEISRGRERPEEHGEASEEGLRLAGEVGGVEAGGVARLLEPGGPEDGEVGENRRVNGSAVLNSDPDAGEGDHDDQV